MITPDTHKIKRALISVSDKAGIVEFAKELDALGVEIFSTGGTKNKLKEAGIPVKSVSDITGFPEILDGRVKTLHPAVHAGLLARLDLENHIKQMDEHNLASIDLLCVNLYPFEETLLKGSPHKDMIENIDIGGPTMLRSAAKNYLWTAPVVNPNQYEEIINNMKSSDGCLTESYREKLAGEVFTHTAYYDSIISGYFRDYNKIEVPDTLSIPLQIEQPLRYGENPHQNAVLYGNFTKHFKQLHGKELSYNNIIDIDAAGKLIIEFTDPTVAIIKHTNPCGVGTGNTLTEAYNKAFATDTVSPFGGIITVNRTLDLETAETIHGIFTEVIIAPEFTAEALELLSKKKNRRLITANYDSLRKMLKYDYKSVTGGFLCQATDTELMSDEGLKVVSKRQPTEAEMKSLKFGWIVCKHVKSNAIVYTVDDRTIGIGAGQMSRVDSARIGAAKAELMGLEIKGTTVASDAFFPFADGVEQAAEAGATAVIQPGGSVRDEEVIAAADKLGIAMVFTGQRHFRH
ncbi:MAG: bifunctional phosphoribosylaminoimidazolecarboxamide formyltransferase/IMP cyclohydrolase [Candidatus Kapabacteria bacterium]|jgi:phosphoribosylaminoimidazolecarboxamide formyltransferase/IMP cyclohydrolase|nr:bifunctional phosphoribosylaminoimidazolecarboxamide formyltransferase/IMP cyclohydrolase [Candidatus Kapabacteria bacterium]